MFSFDWPFQLATVSVPIGGADYLHHHNLLLDVANQKVFRSSSPDSHCHSVNLFSDAFLKLCSSPLYSCISNLLSEFPDVLSYDGFTASLPCHQVRHHLLTHPGPAVIAKP